MPKQTCYHGEHLKCMGINGLGAHCSCKCHNFDTVKMLYMENDPMANKKLAKLAKLQGQIDDIVSNLGATDVQARR